MKHIGFVLLLAFVLFSGCTANSTVLQRPEASQINLTSNSDYSSETTSTQENPQEISAEVFLEAMKQWEYLGGSYDFKSIDSLDLQTLIRIYSSHILYTGEYSSIMDNNVECWMDEDKVNDFAEDYFNLSIGDLTNNLTPHRYDKSRGFLFYPQATAIGRDAQYKLIDSKALSDGTYCFNAEVSFELPKELVPPGEEKILRKIEVVFTYVDGKIHYVRASCQQDGRYL